MKTPEQTAEMLELIEACENKDDLEGLIEGDEEYKGHKLDRRKSLDALKQQAIKIVKGQPEESNQEVESQPQVSTKSVDVSALAASLSDEERQRIEKETEERVRKQLAADAAAKSKEQAPVKPTPGGRKFLRRNPKGGDNRIFTWTPTLAKRPEMFECDQEGRLLADFEEVE